MTRTAVVIEIEELLFDTLDERAAALHASLAAEGITVPIAAVRTAHAGATAEMALRDLIAHDALDTTGRELVVHRASATCSAAFNMNTPLFDVAARDALVALAADFPLAVVTRATQPDAQRLLEQAGLDAYVATIRSLSGTEPAAYRVHWQEGVSRLHAARGIAIAPWPMLPAAKEAGLTVIAIGTPATGAEPVDVDASRASLTQIDASLVASLI